MSFHEEEVDASVVDDLRFFGEQDESALAMGSVHVSNKKRIPGPEEAAAFVDFVEQHVRRLEVMQPELNQFTGAVGSIISGELGIPVEQVQVSYCGSYSRRTDVEGSDVDVMVRTAPREVSKPERTKIAARFRTDLPGIVERCAIKEFCIKVVVTRGTGTMEIDVVFRDRSWGQDIGRVRYPTFYGAAGRDESDQLLDAFFSVNDEACSAVRLLKHQSNSLNCRLPGLDLEHLVRQLPERSGAALFHAAAAELRLGEKSPVLRRMVHDAEGNTWMTEEDRRILIDKTKLRLQKNANFWSNGAHTKCLVVDSNRGNTNAQIFVKTLTGKSLTVDVHLYKSSVRDVMEIVQDREGLPIHEQRLIYGSKQLDAERLLSDYGVQRESIIQLVMRLRGGGGMGIGSREGV